MLSKKVQAKGNNLPLVTIITITYNLISANRRDTFLQTVESVKSQSYPNIEHIIIDGASGDGTLDLIKSSGLTYYSEKDSGIYDALNKGIARANGKYICFLHSDDYFNNKDAVRLSVESLEKTGADFSYATANVLDADDKVKAITKPNIGNAFCRMPFCHQTMFTRTDTLRQYGGFDTKYKSAGDYDLILRLLLDKRKYVEVEDCIVDFRLGGYSDVDVQTSILEQADIFKSLYGRYADISNTDVYNIIVHCILPIKFVLSGVLGRQKIVMNLFMRACRYPKKFFTFRLSKRKGYLKLFGKWIIEKDNSEEMRIFAALEKKLGIETSRNK